MPSRNTFEIGPIRDLLNIWAPTDGRVIIDPFARNSKRGSITNDLDPTCQTQYHEQAERFLLRLSGIGISADVGLIDPPYSPRQIKECYNRMGLPVTQGDTQNARMIASVKNSMQGLMEEGGIVICCGWNSNGMGRSRGYELVDMLIVAHGGAHNDTIVTVERKICGPSTASSAKPPTPHI